MDDVVQQAPAIGRADVVILADSRHPHGGVGIDGRAGFPKHPAGMGAVAVDLDHRVDVVMHGEGPGAQAQALEDGLASLDRRLAIRGTAPDRILGKDAFHHRAHGGIDLILRLCDMVLAELVVADLRVIGLHPADFLRILQLLQALRGVELLTGCEIHGDHRA
jgi:hypothetical protein